MDEQPKPEEQILNNAMGPKEVLTDAGRVTQYDIDEQIKADKYRRSVQQSNSRSNGLGIGMFRTSPGRAVD